MTDGKGEQTYTYNPTTKELTSLSDSGLEGKTFTATYDVEGRMKSETYPNAMTAKYTSNSAGETTAIEYQKTAHCKNTCPEIWFKETVAPSIHGEALSRTSTLASEQYEYDSDGRLTQVQETPAGQGCKTRLYTYNENSDRTSLTTREPGSEGKCATSGGSTENHTYDTADRLTDTGVEYETFGNQTKMPGADAGGKEITATFYVDNQTREETQNSETLHYYLDPEGRNREIYNPGTKTTAIDHYSGPRATICWMSEGEKWTRNIPGIDGSLDAIQSSTGATALQLHDLQGNIVAEAALSESETKLVKSYNSTEFGVPTTSSPPKYSWLGAVGVTTELSSGATASTGDSYIPQLGAPLQTQPVVPPGAAPDGTYIAPYISTLSAGAFNATAAFAAGAPAREAARQKAAHEQWLREHPATSPGVIPPSGGEYNPGWWCSEEEGTCEGGEEGVTQEVMLGDPDLCVLYTPSKPERSEGQRHMLLISGEYTCVGNEAPIVGLKVCAEEFNPLEFSNFQPVDCREQHFTSFSNGITFYYGCTAGQKIRMWAQATYYAPPVVAGSEPANVYSEEIRC